MSRLLKGALAGMVVIGVALAGSIAATPAIAATGTPVYTEPGISPAYPRVVRTADGNLLSTEGRNTVNPNQTAQPFLFQRSTNDGASWSALGSISDYHGLTVSQLLAPSLYVLPQAAGAYPAGTVFLGLTYKASTATVGGVQVFRSSDNGATWTWHSQTAFNKFEDTWEPEFVIDSSGRLVVFYSEEGIAGYSQVLSREISTDGGLTWGSHQIIVGSTGPWRPGMARVVKLKNGSYLLAYESIADIGNQGDGIVRIKTSTDGDTFGTPSDPGAAVMSGIEATPGLGYNPLDGPNGRLVASGWRGGTATSTDNGATWSLISDIVEHGTAGDDAVGFSPSYVAVGSTGLLEMEVTGDVPGEPNRTEVRAAVRTFPVRDDFQDGNDAGWARYGGTWTVTGGAYDVASGASGKSLTGPTSAGDYTVEADVRGIDSLNSSLVFRATNAGNGADAMNGYVAGVNSAGVFLGKMNGAYTAIASAATPVALNTWYHLKVVARGTSISVYLDDMATPKISVTDTSYATGQIGVRSHFAHSQFDNIVSSPIITDDFADGNDTGWIRYGGSWSVSGGVYDVAAGASGKSLIGDAALGNYTVEADVKAIDSLQGGLVFRATAAGAGADAMNGYFVGLNSGAVILGKMNGSYTPVASTPMTLTTGTSYHVKVVAYGSKIAVYVTDMTTPKISVVDTSHAVGQVGFRSHFAHTQFDNLVLR